MSALSAPHFHNEEAAFAFVEARVWPEGPVCPHCGGVERIGTIFESSHVPLRIWLQAMFLIAGSKKGISSNQLHRTLGVTLKTAWFMSHRIREAMRQGNLAPFGQDGGAVEVDETYIGLQKGKQPARAGHAHKMKVLSLVERSTGQVRSIRFDDTRASDIHPIVRANVAKEARLMTDEARMYSKLGREFAEHGTTLHGIGQYVKGDIHTNTVEGVFSIFKRGMKGVYQQCAEKHLHRYLAEFDFRYNHRVALGYSDLDRTDQLVRGIVGKRLTYETTGKGR